MNKVQAIIDEAEGTMMKREMQYNPDGWNYLNRGCMLTYTERDFREIRNDYKLRDNYDNKDYVIAGIPWIAAWGAKLLGAESRSSYKRMLTSNAIAFGLTVGLTSGLKGITKEMRPDGTEENSMPSRHSALAFAGATVLHREFGHINPLISIGGYAAATGTMFLRLHHNRHWLNDIYGSWNRNHLHQFRLLPDRQVVRRKRNQPSTSQHG